MKIDVVTLFPGMFQGPFDESMIRIARERGLVDLRIFDLREFSTDPHRKVDDRPYGGGPGMVLSPPPVFRALEELSGRRASETQAGEATDEAAEDAESTEATLPTFILTTPQGQRYEQETAWQLSRQDHLIILCGHYEGYDERIREGFPFLELSIGDYVLTGGEIPAMALVDSVIRLLPGVVGDPESIVAESFEGGLLDCPQYTRPYDFRGQTVPEVLRSGDHRKIQEWRHRQAVERTEARARRSPRPLPGKGASDGSPAWGKRRSEKGLES